MDTLFRIFILKELHGWSHETALVRYLIHRPELCEQLGFETVPDQSTLWRSGTSASQRTCVRQSRLPLERSSSKPRIRVSEFRVNWTEIADTTRKSPKSRIQTIEPFWTGPTRLPTTSAESSSPRSRWSVVRAVRSTRTPTGICRPTSDFEKTWRLMRGLAASSTSRRVIGRHWVMPIATTFVISRPKRFGACTDRQ